MIRRGLGVILAAATAAWGGVAHAQSFPIRPVTLIVPWPAGGPTDVAMRAIAAATEKHLGQTIVIEYRPGAAGTLGPIKMAATANPDGYTVAQIPVNVFGAPALDILVGPALTAAGTRSFRISRAGNKGELA